MGIKLKIFIYTFSVIIIIATSLGYYNFSYQKDVFFEQKTEDIKFFIEGFSIPVKEALISSDYSRVNNIVNNLNFNIPVNYISVYDANGVCIGSNNPQDLNQTTVSSPVVQVFRDNKGVSAVNNKEIIIVEPMMARNVLYGVLEIRIPVSVLDELTLEFMKKTVVFVLFALIIGFFASYFLANSISKNVYKIINASKGLASGDFSHSIKINSSDEFGYLASIYNKMIFNMKIMFNVIKKINFSTPTEELMEVIMDNIIMALNVERVSILTYDEENEELKLNNVRGLGDEIIDIVSLKPGEGVAGKVFESGIPMILNRGFLSEKFKKFDNTLWRDEKIENIMCMPIKADKEIVGVINVVNKKNKNGFDEFDLKLLQALVEHISTAISRTSLYNETITDGLTGLYIKKYFYSRLEEEGYRAKRYGQSLSLLLIDIDDFEKLNTKLGTLDCDVILMHFGRIIKNNIRLNVDIPARLESDEFALILPETDYKKATFFADRLREKIEVFDFPTESGQKGKLTVSIGVAEFDSNQDLAKLIKNVDEALKISKTKGKNRVTLYEKL
ncbi:MAG: diguanylate cyclase [Candidatus Muiribacteriota bacterium]